VGKGGWRICGARRSATWKGTVRYGKVPVQGVDFLRAKKGALTTKREVGRNNRMKRGELNFKRIRKVPSHAHSLEADDG